MESESFASLFEFGVPKRRRRRCTGKQTITMNCMKHLCQHGGKCFPAPNICSFICQCQKDYYGRRCEYTYRLNGFKVLGKKYNYFIVTVLGMFVLSCLMFSLICVTVCYSRSRPRVKKKKPETTLLVNDKDASPASTDTDDFDSDIFTSDEYTDDSEESHTYLEPDPEQTLNIKGGINVTEKWDERRDFVILKHNAGICADGYLILPSQKKSYPVTSADDTTGRAQVPAQTLPAAEWRSVKRLPAHGSRPPLTLGATSGRRAVIPLENDVVVEIQREGCGEGQQHNRVVLRIFAQGQASGARLEQQSVGCVDPLNVSPADGEEEPDQGPARAEGSSVKETGSEVGLFAIHPSPETFIRKDFSEDVEAADTDLRAMELGEGSSAARFDPDPDKLDQSVGNAREKWIPRFQKSNSRDVYDRNQVKTFKDSVMEMGGSRGPRWIQESIYYETGKSTPESSDESQVYGFISKVAKKWDNSNQNYSDKSAEKSAERSSPGFTICTQTEKFIDNMENRPLAIPGIQNRSREYCSNGPEISSENSIGQAVDYVTEIFSPRAESHQTGRYTDNTMESLSPGIQCQQDGSGSNTMNRRRTITQSWTENYGRSSIESLDLNIGNQPDRFSGSEMERWDSGLQDERENSTLERGLADNWTMCSGIASQGERSTGDYITERWMPYIQTEASANQEGPYWAPTSQNYADNFDNNVMEKALLLRNASMARQTNQYDYDTSVFSSDSDDALQME